MAHIFAEISQVILQEADQPDLAVDLEYADGWPANTEIKFISRAPRVDRPFLIP